MDKFETGVFEISTGVHDFLMDWQLELTEKDLERRARTAMQAIQRLGVPYVTCIYPAKKEENKLILTGWIALAFWQDCEVGECVLSESLYGKRRVVNGSEFEFETREFEHFVSIDEKTYLYRRLR